ncbi:hypothetical protein PV325_007009 [Microctonus aethiopoides]|nr:hypothetical protein PV325_007009 [Microctonus aethiopoides]KAK0093813.1 hypothetical protein PV326_012571 [Microctonus aethiopoides]
MNGKKNDEKINYSTIIKCHHLYSTFCVDTFIKRGLLTESDDRVSWMRQRDMHILSAGISTYTSDLRFQVIHPDKSENWTLQIKSPQQRDSGVYECQTEIMRGEHEVYGIH